MPPPPCKREENPTSYSLPLASTYIAGHQVPSPFVIFALPIYQLLVNPLSGHGPATAIASVPKGLYVKPTYEHASIKVPSNTVVVTLQFSYDIQIMNGYECNGTDIFMR